MSYLSRLKAAISENGLPRVPTELTEAPFVGSVSAQGSPISQITPAMDGPWRLGLFSPGPIGDLTPALVAELRNSGVSINCKAGRVWLSGSKAKPIDTELLRRVMDHLRSFNSRHPPSAT